MHAAFEAGRVVATPVVPTLCDGLAGETEEESFERARRVVDALHLVRKKSGRRDPGAVRPRGVVAEGSGAVGIAAAAGRRARAEGPTAIVISGGNIDRAVLAPSWQDD
jgi:threonine dehydratase